MNSSDYVDPAADSERQRYSKGTPLDAPAEKAENHRYDRYEMERYETQGEEDRRELQADLDLFEAARPATYEDEYAG